MKFHLDRDLRLIELKDGWAIIEIDAQNQEVGERQFPWPWTLSFTAISCTLCDSIAIKPNYEKDESPAPKEAQLEQVIQAKLRPGSYRDDGDYFRETTYTMFGTDREIRSFQLDIRPHAASSEMEACSAWGMVSYTAEVDFRSDTVDDLLIFYLYVKPETFARYAAKVSSGEVDELTLSVNTVAGFYSEWSPSISTRDIKVLTTGREHAVALPAGIEFDPPRLGEVGEATLYINRRLEFGKRAVDPEARDENAGNVGTVRVVPEARSPAIVDPRTLTLLASLKRAAWAAVALLALILIALFLTRS